MSQKILKELPRYNNEEKDAYEELVSLLKSTPIPDTEILRNLGLFSSRASLARYLTMSTLYQKVINTHGVVAEFGSRWGQNLSLFVNLRSIFEPHNFTRKIIGFDTFEGFPEVVPEDGLHPSAKKGAYSVTEGYHDYLDKILSAQEKLAPRSHAKKFELIKGDLSKTLPEYLKSHPETIFAFAYFDLDIYKPTRSALELIIERVPKGGIIAFDELNSEEWPGETLALLDTLGIKNVRLNREQYFAGASYFIVE